jgi:hypothetical protein
MNKFILFLFITLSAQNLAFCFSQNSFEDSTEIGKYIADKKYGFVTAKVLTIKKGEYYLNRWHNFTSQECFIIKIKVTDKLTSKFRKGQILKIATEGASNNGFTFKYGEEYFITYFVHPAKINGKYKTLPWTDKEMPTKLLQEALYEIKQVKGL